MKNYLSILIVILLMASVSCQKPAPKQYFESSTEIDVCKKAIEAYLTQDWEMYRSCYADTAKIWHNKYFAKYPPQNIDDIISNVKGPLASSVYYRYEGVIWEMIIQNGGQNWVHFWGNWVGKMNDNSDEVETMVHVAYSLENGKIVMEAGFWDNLPLYLANQKLKKNNEQIE